MKKNQFVMFGIMLLAVIQLTGKNKNKIKYGKLSEGKRAFVQNGKMGFMDAKNKILLAPVFDFDTSRFDKFEEGDNGYIPYFSDGMCMFYEIYKKEYPSESLMKYGFINREFKIVIPAIYFCRSFNGNYCDGFPTVFTRGRAVVNKPSETEDKDDEFIIIDKQGNTISQSFEYWTGCYAGCLYFPEISEEYCTIFENQKAGYIDAKTGKKIIQNKYSMAGPFSEGIAAVEHDYEYITFINKAGKQITNKRFYTAPMNKNKTKIEKRVDDTFYDKWLYGPGLGCSHVGGFKEGKMILRYYDNEGTGPVVIALVDKNGKVLIKKKADDNYIYDSTPASTNDPDFIPYKWVIGKH
jgi:hypothetical protein